MANLLLPAFLTGALASDDERKCDQQRGQRHAPVTADAWRQEQ